MPAEGHHRHHRPERRRQDHAVQHHLRLPLADRGAHLLRGRRDHRRRARTHRRPRARAHVSAGAAVPGPDGRWRTSRSAGTSGPARDLLAALLRPRWARQEEAETERRARELLAFVGLGDQADTRGVGAALWPAAPARDRARARRGAQAAPARRAGRRPQSRRDRTALAHHPAVRERGTTVLLIEHDMRLVMNTADRHRRARLSGARSPKARPPKCRRNPDVIEAYLGGVEMLHA